MRCGAALEKLRICIRSQQSRDTFTLSPLLSALSPSVLRRLVEFGAAPTSPAESGSGSAAATSSESAASSELSPSDVAVVRALSLEVLSVLCDRFDFARRICEAGAVQACLSIVRREPFDNEPALYWCVRLVSGQDCRTPLVRVRLQCRWVTHQWLTMSHMLFVLSATVCCPAVSVGMGVRRIASLRHWRCAAAPSAATVRKGMDDLGSSRRTRARWHRIRH
jgi:hypothetical protein